MALRNNSRFEVGKLCHGVGYQIRFCNQTKCNNDITLLRSTVFLVKDTQEPKVQKIITWSDFGPYKSLDDKALQSIAKSVSSLEVRHFKQSESLQNH